MSWNIAPIYQLSSNPDLYPFSNDAASCYEDGLDYLFSGFTDSEHVNRHIESLLNRLENAGIHFKTTDNDETFFVLTEQNRQKWFQNHLMQLKQDIYNLTLHAFSDTGIASSLMNLIDSDKICVFYDGCFMTFDRFIRVCPVDTKIWIDTTSVIEAE